MLRRADQATIAALTLIALVGMAAWWLAKGGHRGELVDIENAPPLDYRFLVDVNRAEWPELSQLPGIGPTLAKRIVAHREEGGAFRSIEELIEVNGVGPRKLETMRRYLKPLADDTQVAEKSEPPIDADERG